MKFSIVTPSYNSQKYIGETIESVISQKGDFEIEYIVVDACSTDRTPDIVKAYQHSLLTCDRPIFCRQVTIKFLSGKDSGMYEAINKGFAKATGDIYAWINSDDVYRNGAFDTVSKTFSKFSQIRWLKGITSYLDEASTLYASGKCNLYSRQLISKGLYGPVLHFIQQDSVFWLANLWHESGGVDESLSLAGDYFLWIEFSKHTHLYSLNAHISCFRKVAGQKSENIQAYFNEISEQGYPSLEEDRLLRFYFKHRKRLPSFLHPLACKLFQFNRNYRVVMMRCHNTLTLVKGPHHTLRNAL
ncbi:glycosyltransferase [Desulfoluna butyratoxydans]|uniref:Nucleotide-diphospho-sugar transferases n=1 Tax=Desulfoluna butyratoxydans TaxID=231438 RepID=A0A4U8YV43_9BACT|nr:glycosyltransferase [Desulfoluna butyratoxydans]VFQ47299.1 nucleotide-diphospho-sugar transferases [Desulfoluna butyratoxydans]